MFGEKNKKHMHELEAHEEDGELETVRSNLRAFDWYVIHSVYTSFMTHVTNIDHALKV